MPSKEPGLLETIFPFSVPPLCLEETQLDSTWSIYYIEPHMYIDMQYVLYYMLGDMSSVESG